MGKCLNCDEEHAPEENEHGVFLSWYPCLFCRGLLNPCAVRLVVSVEYADGSKRSGLAHQVCTEAECNWAALGLSPREVTIDHRSSVQPPGCAHAHRRSTARFRELLDTVSLIGVRHVGDGYATYSYATPLVEGAPEYTYFIEDDDAEKAR